MLLAPDGIANSFSKCIEHIVKNPRDIVPFAKAMWENHCEWHKKFGNKICDNSIQTIQTNQTNQEPHQDPFVVRCIVFLIIVIFVAFVVYINI